MTNEQFQQFVIEKLDELTGDIGWIKGKLEGKSEFSRDIKTWIAIAVAVGAAMLAWFK